ncbi:MAG: DUF2061 domain-containing protein [Rhodoferax sp.]|nr:DUF2061 domain-containing protein [Rhodoferax sp.]
MRFRHHSNDLAKTLAFGVIHVVLAIAIGWLLTGTFVFGAMLALVEPLCNTVVSHGIGMLMPDAHRSRRMAVRKSVVVGVAHLVVAVMLVRLFTGSFVSAWLYALIEPAANAVAHYFFERWWHRAQVSSAPAASAA